MQKQRYVGLDLSLSSPGFAVIDVKNQIPKLIATSIFKTNQNEPRTLRYEAIEAHALLFFRQYRPDGTIVRETWPPSRCYQNNDKVHGAWSAVDRALARLGLEVGAHIAPSTIKKRLTGSGNATKAEVAAAVRRILQLPETHNFSSGYDDSDACATALAYLIDQKLIKGEN